MTTKKSKQANVTQKANSSRRASTTPTINGNQWTVMVYMAGDNTLAGESIWALTEMNSVALNGEVEVIALFDSVPPEVETKRFTFKQRKQGISPEQEAPLLEDLGKKFNRVPLNEDDRNPEVQGEAKAEEVTVNTASDYRLLQRFLTTTIRDHPSKKYLLVLSGHGSGAVGDFLTSDNPKGSLSITDLKKVLRAVKRNTLKRKIDILGMDSCLMSMVEVCYEVRTSASLLVGAEGFEPETGWPYRKILEKLSETPEMVPDQLAETIVDEHIRYYKNYATAGLSIDQSVCDLAQIDELADAIRNLAETMIAHLSEAAVQDAIILAHWRAQSYKSEQYVDLWDFCDLLKKNCPVVLEACAVVQNLVAPYEDSDQNDRASQKCVVKYSDYYGPAFQHSHGLSIFFPWKDSEALREYCKGLSFAKDTKWGNFLKEYVKQTQRKMRRWDEKLDKLEEVKITATTGPLVIPVLSDFPAGNRQPPGGDRQPPGGDRQPPGGPRQPPGGDRGLFKQGTMKNAPRYFLREKSTKKAAR